MNQIPDIVSRYGRVALSAFPTPLEYAENLTRFLGGPKIYIKRDDCTALAFGGNKTRKLEFIMAKAREEGADTVVTLGGVQSNWVRQTIAAARHMGMDAVAVLEGEKPKEYQGNLLLDKLMGAELIFHGPVPQEEEDLEIQGVCPITGKVAEELAARGKKPFLAPLGGATPLGALGYINMIGELKEQMDAMGIRADYLVSGVGTGGTQAGMECGVRLAGMDTKVLGISISRHTRPKEEEIAEMCGDVFRFLGVSWPELSPGEISICYDYVGAGYGAVTDQALEAIGLAARLEGLILCHTYAGKALGGLIDLIRRGELTSRDTAVFVHTGGGVANFAHTELF
ncbi:MAG: D-cysteine desulfhydrase family protein [Oscillospiraceae bacterium]|nr:D-cysteine desulfhydrase family protein [Oscillospiraceae bacterium]